METGVFVSDIREVKIQDATVLRRDRKEVFTEEACYACSSRCPDGITSCREREA